MVFPASAGILPAFSEAMPVLSNEFLRPKSFSWRVETRFYIMLLLAASIFFIASCIGSGWALFLSAAMFCICFLSLVMPFVLLKCISAKIIGPEVISAGDAVPMVLHLSGSSFLVSMSRWFLVQLAPPKQYLFKEENIETLLFEQLPAGSISLACPGLKRGIRCLPELQIETSFPFGLLWFCASFQSKQSLAILPRRETLEGQFLYRLRSCNYVPGESRSVNDGLPNSSSSRGVRNYMRGDSRRHIHWASSARQGRLMVREFEKEGLPAFDLVFDLACSWKDSAQFELAISAAASILQLGHNLGVHPELSFSNEGRSADIDLQLLQLAALDFKELCSSAGSQQSKNGGAVSGGFTNELLAGRSNAVVLITALACAEKTNKDNSENYRTQPEQSRNTIFTFSISPDEDATKLTAAGGNEFILSKPEELSLL